MYMYKGALTFCRGKIATLRTYGIFTLVVLFSYLKIKTAFQTGVALRDTCPQTLLSYH